MDRLLLGLLEVLDVARILGTGLSDMHCAATDNCTGRGKRA